jgi:hypothetical protein
MSKKQLKKGAGMLLRLQPTTLKSDGGMVAFFIYCMFTME